MYKKFFFLFVLLSTVVVNAQWVQTNGPYGGNVTCITASGTNLFAIISGGVYFSTNNGTSWAAAADSGLPNYSVSALVVSPTSTGINLFLGEKQYYSMGKYYGGGVFLSTNYGTSWTALNNGLPDTNVYSLAVNGTNLFAGTVNGVYLSTNNGEGWTPVNNGLTYKSGNHTYAQSVYSIAVADTNIFVGTSHGVFLSTNNGTSWAAVNSGLPNYTVQALAISPNGTGGTNIFAGTTISNNMGGSGVFLSTNYGTSWSSIGGGAGYSTGAVLSLAACPNGNGGTNLYAGMYPNPSDYNPGGGIFLTSNNGISWAAVNSGLTNSIVQAIAFTTNGTGGSNIFAGTQAGVFISTNNGISWTSVNAGLPFSNVLSLVAYPIGTNSLNLLAGTNGGVFLSTNNGINWTEINNGLKYYNVNSVAVSPDGTGGASIFAGANNTVYHSTNNGASWDSSLVLLGETFVGAVPNVTGGTNVFAGAPYGSGGFLISTDNGASWERTRLFGSQFYSSFAADPSGTNILVGGSGEIFISTNNGTNWTGSNSGLPNCLFNSVAIIPNGTGGAAYFAGSSNINNNLPAVLREGYGVFRSTNSGISWIAVDSGLTGSGLFINALAVSGTNLFAGTTQGVYLSTNNGTSWTEVNNDLLDTYVNVLAVTGTNLFAGTNGAGVWMGLLSEIITGVKNQQNNLPINFSLQQNFPNPFNPSTTINYSVPKTSLVTIKVYDILGREIATLVSEEKTAGDYSVQFNGGNHSSGIYFYRMQSGNLSQTKKLILLK